ncbi:hypothetical protein SAMN05444004_11424 [Jannaschia faecimaris]|uniref:DUF1737 domain-containing protein n=1 Tax=Jannaschia faecimaris TaxID=1244108 RepID=A0A1H3SWH3_9RHOB|nr:DUF1737 domain-containing protein [Jannaschia faecimaris]SDZ42473.1 hypothetical protein SAMN05444004_11424 [Jannaschia faecimaris]
MATLYRLLTAEDDSAFCHKVSDALAKGWVLHGSPTFAWDQNANAMRCAQAVTKDIAAAYDPAMKLGAQ